MIVSSLASKQVYELLPEDKEISVVFLLTFSEIGLVINDDTTDQIHTNC